MPLAPKLAIATLLLLPLSAAGAPKVWERDGTGPWQPVTQPSATSTQPVSSPELDRIEQLLDARRYEAAKDQAIAWLLKPENKTSPVRDRTLFLTARALYADGNRIKAFYYIDELLDTYPESPLYGAGLEYQYKIADSFLDGYKQRFLGMRILSATDDAIEMLYRIQSRSPGSAIAERSLLRTADFYYKEADYDFAADAFAAFLRQYPRSPKVPVVRLHRAYASLAQFNGSKFDATPVIDGREQLRAIIALYPKLAEEENVAKLLNRVDAVLAQKLLTTADFYRRTRQPAASAYTLKYAIKAYPNTPEAKQAQHDLAELPQWAQAQPGPESVGDDAAQVEESMESMRPTTTPTAGEKYNRLPPVPGSRGR